MTSEEDSTQLQLPRTDAPQHSEPAQWRRRRLIQYILRLSPLIILTAAGFILLAGYTVLYQHGHVDTGRSVGSVVYNDLFADADYRVGEAVGWSSYAGDLDGDGEVGVAFYVHASPRDVGLLGEWIRRAYHPQNSYLIHLDADVAPGAAAEAVKVVQTYQDAGNVGFLEPREALRNPDGASVLLNHLAGMTTLLTFRKTASWSHFIFAQPGVFPLVTPDDLRQLLGESARRSFLTFGSYEALKRDQKLAPLWWRLSKIHIDPVSYDRDGPMTQLADMPWQPFTNESLVKGGMWQILTRRDCAYAVASPRSKWMLSRVATIYRPVEWYFANLLIEREVFKAGKRDHRYSLGNDRLHHFVWEPPAWGDKTTPGNIPLALYSKEKFFPDIAASGALFAGVFDQSSEAAEIAGLVDSKIIGNATYTKLIRDRMNRACDATHADCRDGTRDAWYY